MNMRTISFLFGIFGLLFLSFNTLVSQTDDPKEIIQKSIDQLNGEYNQGEIKMIIVRPKWTREITMKTWAKGTEHSLILITDPVRDKGTAFLKRDKEIWNWQPKIDRTIKLPPSMMMQSWMGSDFTNDDLVKESSMADDYQHKLLGKEEVNGREAYKIEMIPNEDAPVVWGKIITWIGTEKYLQLKTEFFDEDGYLVNTMTGKNIREIGGKILPTTLELIPEDEPENKTLIEYVSLNFDDKIPDEFFSVQNMKRVR
jgi:outer membrane lipoprotein-sorting protein